MRRALLMVCVSVSIAVAAGSAGATWYAAICWDNMNNTSTDPHSPANGLFWIDTGSGPALVSQDINWQLLCGGSSSALTALVNPGNQDGTHPANGPQYSTELLSDGTAAGNGTFFGSGILLDQYGTEWFTSINAPRYYFQVKAWTGNYSTYDAACAASASGVSGVYVGQTAPFLNPYRVIGVGMMPVELDSMPALILAKAVPEPSTLLLAGAGVAGLLICGWRRWK